MQVRATHKHELEVGECWGCEGPYLPPLSALVESRQQLLQRGCVDLHHVLAAGVSDLHRHSHECEVS